MAGLTQTIPSKNVVMPDTTPTKTVRFQYVLTVACLHLIRFSSVTFEIANQASTCNQISI
jgi:hypothetical protein